MGKYAPELIQADLERGRLYFADKTQGFIEAQRSGTDCGCTDKTGCMYHILTTLQFKVDEGEYDSTADRLYEKLIIIIGGVRTDILINFTYMPNDPYGDILSGVDIDYLFNKHVSAGEVSVGLNFTPAANNNFWLVRAPVNLFPINNWSSSGFNNGTMGDSVFRDKIVTADYVYYLTRRRDNYLEENKETITFS